jgi:hypothetical protein
MREHQIVISLKSEHFQQVQRMARAAGSKSVGLFIRQRLLAALGLDGHDAPEPERGGPDWQRISGQLRRLHRELQVFIAESVSSDTGNINDQPLIMPEENFLTEGAPVMPNYNYDYQANRAAVSQPPPPPVAPVKNVPAFDAKSDEMEKLADRAFAISPRLGALESIDTRAKDLQDPLKDLLGEPLESHADDDDEQEETPAVEDETAAVEEADEDQADTEETSTVDDQLEDDEDSLQPTAQPSHQAAAAAGFPDMTTQPLAGDNEVDQRLQRSSATNDEIDTQAEDEAQTEEPKDMGNPPAPPPISGGPPPRKR